MPKLVKLALLVVAAAGLAWLSFAQAMTGVGKKSPDLVLRFSPSNSAALGLLADVELVQSDKKGYLERSEALALRSAMGQAVNPRALRQLGLIHDARGDKEGADRLIRLSEKMSRRDLGAQFWLVRREAENDNLAAAVKHIDVGLRTHPGSNDMLFPILTKAIENKDVQDEVRKTLRQNPTWLAGFLEYAFARSENLASVAAVMEPLPASMPGYDGRLQDRLLMEQLVAKKQYAVAQEYYQSKPYLPKALLTSLDFSPVAISADTQPFGWSLLDNNAAVAAFDQTQDGVQLFVRIDYARSGDLLSKILFLKAGTYRLTANYGDVSSDAPTGLQYRVYCLSPDQAEAIEVLQHVDVRANKSINSNFNVPASCSVQRLVVAVDGKSAIKDSQIGVRGIQLARIENASK